MVHVLVNMYICTRLRLHSTVIQNTSVQTPKQPNVKITLLPLHLVYLPITKFGIKNPTAVKPTMKVMMT